AGDRNAGGMNLCEGWIGKQRASFVSAIGSCHIAAARIGRQIVHVAVPAAREHDGIRSKSLHFSRAQVPSDDSLGFPVDDYQGEHFCVWEHLPRARGDLATQRLVTA